MPLAPRFTHTPRAATLVSQRATEHMLCPPCFPHRPRDLAYLPETFYRADAPGTVLTAQSSRLNIGATACYRADALATVLNRQRYRGQGQADQVEGVRDDLRHEGHSEQCDRRPPNLEHPSSVAARGEKSLTILHVFVQVGIWSRAQRPGHRACWRVSLDVFWV